MDGAGRGLISIRGVGKYFYKKKGKEVLQIKVLEKFNLDVKKNEFVSVIGPSGCGKTTVLRLIDGLLPFEEGEILIGGKRIFGPGPDRSVVFQSFALLPWRDVLGNVEYGLEVAGVPKKERQNRSRDMIEKIGLKGFEHHYPHELSGGMQQRVGLARALVPDPEILLMDEPFGALDAQTRQLLQDQLLELCERNPKTIIFITHAMDEAVYLADRVAIMTPRPGKVDEVLDVPLARPRHEVDVRVDKALIEMTHYIWERLKTSYAKAGESDGGV